MVDRNVLSALPDVKGIIDRTDEIQLIIGFSAADIYRLCTGERNR
jgi:phosphotransferase system IIB component